MGLLDLRFLEDQRKQKIFGVIVGLVLPIISLGVLKTTVYRAYEFDTLLSLFKQFGILSKLLALMVVPNFFLFFFLLKKNLDQAANGLVYVTVAMATIIVMVSL